MRRILLTVTLVIILTAILPTVQAQDRDESERRLIEVPYSASIPTIDGVLSPGEWEDAAVDYVSLDDRGFYGDGADSWSGPEDSSFHFWVKYDGDFIYFGVDVKDDAYISENYGEKKRGSNYPVWENDAVEYFFDGDLSRSETRNDPLTGGQFILGLGTEPANTVYKDITDDLIEEGDYEWVTIWDENTNDWSQEAKFALYMIGEPGEGDSIGFNINVDDPDTYDPQTRDPDNTDYIDLRDTQVYWEAFPTLWGGNVNAQGTENIENMWGTMTFLPEGVNVEHWDLF